MSEAGGGITVVRDLVRIFSREVARVGSPFYGRLLELMADDVVAGGPSYDLLAPVGTQVVDGYYPLRLLAAAHWRALQGKAPELAAHFASTGGDDDADAAWPHVRRMLADHPPELDRMIAGHIQTNEASRAGALIVGFLDVAERTGLSLRALEVGASAGLNLQFDRFHYAAGGQHLGPSDSKVRFVDYWRDGTPAFEARLEVVERRGCDLAPIDVTDPSERTRLLSFVWPDQHHRFATIRDAIEIAAADPAPVDRAPIPDWLEQQLAGPPPAGVATVVFHSIAWVYLDDDERRRATAALERAGEQATPDAPVAWLRYEDVETDARQPELRLRLWPDGTDRLLGTGNYHYGPFTFFSG